VVVNEAMAAGVPVVASESVGAAADLIRPGETGVRFMPGDVDGLAAALEAVLEDGDVLGVRHRTRAVVANWGYGAACASLAAAIEHVRREPEATA
jgi:glycosyltransferase involved in cell wall biosynthesis